MQIECLGGARTVTGSSFLIKSQGIKALVDCGMFQGGRTIEARNFEAFAYKPAEVDFLLLTHAHIDHSGLIPRLVKEGFRGKIICTTATRDLCEIMLADSAHIQEMEFEWRTRKKKRAGRREKQPLYTVKDAQAAMKYFHPVNYREEVELKPGWRVTFQDAGHILGSAILELTMPGEGQSRKIVFSGDLGHTGQPLLNDPTPINTADWVFMESTYGDRRHRDRESTVREFKEIIQAAKRDGGNIIIPAFAVDRTQEIIFLLHELFRKKEIPPVDVFVDSPLAISATEIFLRHKELMDPETSELLRSGDNPLEFPQLRFSYSTEDSMALNKLKGGAIIISASGMCNAGRIKHHLKYNLWKPETHVVIVGFQAQGTLGRLLVDGVSRVKILGDEIAVKAKIHTIGGFSAHADQAGLLEWLGKFSRPPQTVFLVHGEEKSTLALAQTVENKLGFHTVAPHFREAIKLSAAGIAAAEVPPPPVADFETEMEQAYRQLESLLSRMRDLDDTAPAVDRAALAAKLKDINSRLAELQERI